MILLEIKNKIKLTIIKKNVMHLHFKVIISAKIESKNSIRLGIIIPLLDFVNKLRLNIYPKITIDK